MFVQAFNCGNCNFYHTSTKSCRRFPPTVCILGMKQSLVNPNAGEPILGTFFPQMQSTGWCGEHHPREDETDA